MKKKFDATQIRKILQKKTDSWLANVVVLSRLKSTTVINSLICEVTTERLVNIYMTG